MKRSVYLMIALISLFVIRTVSAQTGPLLSPPQLIELMNGSSIAYTVHLSPNDSVRDVAEANLFHRQRKYTPVPKIEADGTISTWNWAGLTQEAAQQAEKDFSAGNFDAARKDYEKILSTSPDCYLAIANIGDCCMRNGKLDSAVAYYDKAIAISKIDYLPYYYKADVLYKQHKDEEARQAMIDVLTLRPRYWNAIRQIKAMPDMRVTLHDSLFAPLAYAQQSAKGVDVVVSSDTNQVAWLSYAMGKAVWLGEPSHRKSLTGSEAMSWSMRHEIESIGALISAYESLKQNHGKKSDQIETIESVASDELLNAYVLYEIGSRMDEDIMLTADPKVRENVRHFVEKYILPKT
jgi:hypothetical protein